MWECVGVPYRPADLRQTLKIGGERTLGPLVVRGDAVLRLRYPSLDVRNRPLRGMAGPGELAVPEPRDFQRLQGFTVFPEPNPLPGDVAIAVSDHGAAAMANLPSKKDRPVWLTLR